MASAQLLAKTEPLKDEEEQKLQKNKSEHQGDKSVAQQTDFIGATFVVFIISMLIASTLCMIIMLLIGRFYVYYCAVFVYELIIIYHYGIPLLKFSICNDKKLCESIDKYNNKSCWSIIYKYWFRWQIIFCFTFNIITSILLFTNVNFSEHSGKYFIEGLSYLFGAFSIPLPIICLTMYPSTSSLSSGN